MSTNCRTQGNTYLRLWRHLPSVLTPADWPKPRYAMLHDNRTRVQAMRYKVLSSGCAYPDAWVNMSVDAGKHKPCSLNMINLHRVHYWCLASGARDQCATIILRRRGSILTRYHRTKSCIRRIAVFSWFDPEVMSIACLK
jgi:hypothetical protein